MNIKYGISKFSVQLLYQYKFQGQVITTEQKLYGKEVIENEKYFIQECFRSIPIFENLFGEKG